MRFLFNFGWGHRYGYGRWRWCLVKKRVVVFLIGFSQQFRLIDYSYQLYKYLFRNFFDRLFFHKLS